MPPLDNIPYKISRLIEKAVWDTEGISPDRLRDMLQRSTRITHEKGNRRFHAYLFNIEGNVLYAIYKLREVADEIVVLERPEDGVVEHVDHGKVVRIRKPVNVTELRPRNQPALLVKPPPPRPAGTITCDHCDGKGSVTVMDDCEECHGRPEGCDFCDKGLVPNVISCPICKGARFVKPPH